MSGTVTIVVESYTYSEDRDLALLGRSLRTACEMQRHDPERREVVFADICPPGELSELLRNYPEVRQINVTGRSYDQMKLATAREVRGEYLLFLDGDCLPQPGWLEAHCAALMTGEAVATGGFTRYTGGHLAAICTLLDFGFMFPVKRRTIGCYASNNCGFLRAAYLEVPIEQSEMRSNAYAHTQALLRASKPVLLIPEARVRHACTPFFSERFRQGFDLVAACRMNPALGESAFLPLGVFAAPLFYGQAVLRDLKRLAAGYRDLDLPVWFVPVAALLLPVFRLVDFCGIVKALHGKGWHG